MAAGDELKPTAAEIAAGERLLAGQWHFVRGVATLDSLPVADRPEVAFAGRSNVGKSSLINAVANHGTLARTSNTPGRTQELNYFRPPDRGIGSQFYLVDMPGYGFAKAPKDKVESWVALVKDYLRGRASLKRVFLLIDARHGVKTIDEEIIRLLDEAAVSFQIVLTKADKISAADLLRTADAARAHAARHPAAFPHLIVTSSERRQGIDELRGAIVQACGIR